MVTRLSHLQRLDVVEALDELWQDGNGDLVRGEDVERILLRRRLAIVSLDDPSADAATVATSAEKAAADARTALANVARANAVMVRESLSKEAYLAISIAELDDIAEEWDLE